jgi:hypothetical protein
MAVISVATDDEDDVVLFGLSGARCIAAAGVSTMSQVELRKGEFGGLMTAAAGTLENMC